MRAELRRGAALGLWTLAGLAFLLAALFPSSAGARVLGPALVAVAVAWTALVPRGTRAQRTHLHSSGYGEQARRRVPSGRALGLVALATLLALALAITIVREGDRRSFLYAAFTAVIALVLAYPSREP